MMHRRLVLAFLLAVIPPVMTPHHARAQTSPPSPPPVLLARPAGGHPGDVLYLSGANLLPYHQYYVFMACPDWHTPGVYTDGNYNHIENGPLTDGKGDFTNFPMLAIHLHDLRSSDCHIYIGAGGDSSRDDGFGTPTAYHIYAPDQKLPYCDTHICKGKVVASPKRVHSGLLETIAVHGWPGAVARVTLLAGSSTVASRTVHLDATGTAHLRIHAAKPMLREGSVLVHVAYSLGSYHGEASTRFAVVR